MILTEGIETLGENPSPRYFAQHNIIIVIYLTKLSVTFTVSGVQFRVSIEQLVGKM